ncbi:MAG TPA: zf-HC2 domain-containing protein [Chryseosolibacter sp.]|nr:zf-HC2 domain-containing protein [Chryseosolibacter sp.]
MNCKKNEKLIYLYDELSDGQREQLRLHVQSCPKCQEIFSRAQKQRTLFDAIRPSTESESTDPVRTRRIMARINAINAPATRPAFFQGFLTAPATRYALACLSAILVTSFAIEIGRVSPVANPTVSIEAREPSARVNTAALYEQVKRSWRARRRSTDVGLYACLRACESNSDVDCGDCKTKYLKD